MHAANTTAQHIPLMLSLQGKIGHFYGCENAPADQKDCVDFFLGLKICIHGSGSVSIFKYILNVTQAEILKVEVD